jgi:hypothetical protein
MQLPTLTRPTHSAYIPLDESRGLFNTHQSAAFASSRPPAKGIRIDDGYFAAAVEKEWEDEQSDDLDARSFSTGSDIDHNQRVLVGGQLIQF